MLIIDKLLNIGLWIGQNNNQSNPNIGHFNHVDHCLHFQISVFSKLIVSLNLIHVTQGILTWEYKYEAFDSCEASLCFRLLPVQTENRQ